MKLLITIFWIIIPFISETQSATILHLGSNDIADTAFWTTSNANGMLDGVNSNGSHTMNWARVNKTGSSLADIPTRLFSDLQTKPTTLSGYGITDPVVTTSGSYANPSWITSLAWSKLNATPTTLGGYGITNAQAFDTFDHSSFQLLNTYAAIKAGAGIILAGFGDSVVDLAAFPGIRDYLLSYIGDNAGVFGGSTYAAAGGTTADGTTAGTPPIANTASGLNKTISAASISGANLSLTVSNTTGLSAGMYVQVLGSSGAANDGFYTVVSDSGTTAVLHSVIFQAPVSNASETGNLNVPVWNHTIYDVPSSGTLTYYQSFTGSPIIADTFRVYYLKEPSAGSFKVQTSTDGGSTWTDSSPGTVAAANATTQAGIVSWTQASNTYQMRVLGTSGTVRIISGGMWLSTSTGLRLADFSTGGVQLSSFTALPANILGTILADVSPTIGVVCVKDNSTTLAVDLPQLETVLATNLPAKNLQYATSVGSGTSVDLIYQRTNPTTTNAQTQIDQNVEMDTLAVTYHRPVFDEYSRFFSGDATAAQNWGLLDVDGVHPTTFGQSFLAWQQMKTLGLFDGPATNASHLRNSSIDNLTTKDITIAAGGTAPELHIVGAASYNAIQIDNGSIQLDGSNAALTLAHGNIFVQGGYSNSILFYASPHAAPGSPAEGEFYSDSSTHHLDYYNGSAWKQLDLTAGTDYQAHSTVLDAVVSSGFGSTGQVVTSTGSGFQMSPGFTISSGVVSTTTGYFWAQGASAAFFAGDRTLGGSNGWQIYSTGGVLDFFEQNGGNVVRYSMQVNGGQDEFFSTFGARLGTSSKPWLSFFLSGGTSGQALTTNGSGTTTWSTVVTPTNVSLTNQSADISSTNIVTSAGLYRVSYSLQDTTSDGAAGSVTLSFGYTDGAGATTASSSAQVLTSTGRTSGSVFIQLASGNLTYSTSHAGSFGTSKYAVYVVAEKLN